MDKPSLIAVSELARKTRAVVERLEKDPATRLVVMKNNRPVAVISGMDAGEPAPGAGGAPPRSLRDEVLQKADLVRTLALAHGAQGIELFGSVARGEDRPESDIDLLVELQPGRSLLDLIGLENDLTDLFGRKVDVATRHSLKPRVLKAALKEKLRIV
ncbi:MAG TPA: nucleotidyltransferase family protein [Burkholderiales bacterium]|nr:nucleotidyltransferase family protein [Burkholderiales bacterium]